MSRTPEKFKGEEKEIAKYIQTVEKGTAGTEAYRMAVVKLIGVLGRDGMESRLKTIGGALGNINDVFQNFMINMVGYSQVQGTLAATIKDTIVDKILKPLSEAHVNLHSATKESIATVDQLGRIGKGVGEILISVWDGVGESLGFGVNTLVDYIDRLDVFFSDFKNNVAPIVLFIALVRMEIEDFLKGFWAGFSTTFKWFLGAIREIYEGIGNFVLWLGLAETKSEALGKVLGTVTGLLLGIKLFRIATNPFLPLISGAQTLVVWLDRVIFKQRISAGLGRMMAGNFKSGWTLIAGGFGTITTAVSTATTAIAAFLGISVGAFVAIAAAVLAVVGWIVYLVMYWDEWQQKMQGVSDLAIGLLAVFAPIVGIPMLLGKYWNEFVDIFDNVWNTIKNNALTLWIYFKAYVIDPIKNAFHLAWLFVKNAAMDAFNWLLDKFPVLNLLVNVFKQVWVDLKQIFSDIWGWVEKLWGKFTDSNFMKNIIGFFQNFTSDTRTNSEERLANAYRNTGQYEEAQRVEQERMDRLYARQTQGQIQTRQEVNQTTKEADTKYDMRGASFNVSGANPNELFKSIQDKASKR